MAQEPDLVVSAGFSDAQLVREANKVVAAFKKRGEEAQKAFQDAQGKVSNSQALKAHVRELDRLSNAYDHVYRAASKYEKEVKRLDRALDVGAISQQKYTAEVARAAREMTSATAVTQTTEQGSRRFGGSLQQVGYQVGDFAVQVGGGTSAVQALGQQLPQLLGAFGAVGALAGAAAAILIPLGAALFRVATDSKSLEERTNDLTKSTDEYVDAAKSAVTPIDDLRKQYGDLADEVQRASQAQSMFTAFMAKRDLAGTAGALAGNFGSGDFNQSVGLIGTDYEARLGRLRRALGGNAQAALAMSKALDALAASKGPEDVLASVTALQTILADTATAGGDLSDDMTAFFAQLSAVATQAQRQIDAGISAQIRAQQDLVDKYETTTDKMKSLYGDWATAQNMLADAQRSGHDAAVDQAQERLRLIEREINETKALARETDTAFQSMLSAYTEYADSRRAGNEWASSPQGFEAQYVAQRASGAGSAEEELVRAVTALAEQMDISAKDLLAVMSFETGGQLRPNTMGPTTKWGQHFGLIQFGDKGAGPRYGVTPESSITEQVIAAGKYLEDAGVKAGDSLANVYAAVLSGNARNVNASDLAAGGVVGNVTEATSGDQFAPHLARAEGLLAAYGGIAQQSREDAAEADRSLKDQIRERERLAKQAKDYGDQLSANLLTQQQESELAQKQAAAIAGIKAQGMDPETEARGIALVTAEVERQRTVMALYADAKKRSVDLDALMTDSTITYRQAIEALGEAKAADIVATQERAIAESKVAEAQAFMAAQQQAVEQGLVRSIVAGESFAQVLANVATAFAEAALQAALFNTGPMAAGGAGSGILGGVTDWIFGKRGFASGGYTGPGGKYQPAGVVHKGEYVFSKAAVEKLGPGALDDLHRRTLRGYSEGGYVSSHLPSPSMSVVDRPASAQAQRDPMDIHITAAFDESGNLYVKNVARMEAASAASAQGRASTNMINQRTGSRRKV